jgi:hypothetical protein
MKINHTTGYICWLFGNGYWHRTLEGAINRARENLNWCRGEQSQVIEVGTGRRMW